MNSSSVVDFMRLPKQPVQDHMSVCLHPCMDPALSGTCSSLLQFYLGGNLWIVFSSARRYTGHVSGALIDARSVSSLWSVSDTSRNKGVWCSLPPQFTAMPPPGDSKGLRFDMRQPTVSLLNV